MAFENEFGGKFAFGNVNSDDELEQEDEFWDDPDVQIAFGAKRVQKRPPQLTATVAPLFVTFSSTAEKAEDWAQFDEVPPPPVALTTSYSIC